MSTYPTLAFVSDAIYPYNKGGKEMRLFEITTRLAAQGYDVHIYCMKWWQGSIDKVENGVHLHGICPLIPLYDGPRRSIKQGVLFGLSCFKLFGYKFDVVDVDHMPFFPLYSTKIVCFLKRKTMIATWHEVWGQEYWQTYLGGIKGQVAWWIERMSTFFPDIVVAVSDLTANRLKTLLKYSGQLVVLSNGITIAKINEAKKSTNKSDIIYAGRLLAHKRIDVLIEAVAKVRKKVPSIKALIVGDGPEKVRLQELVSTLKIEKNIDFLPFQEKISEVYGLMKASKIFVLPSEREGFGLVVLEANACGIPVITNDCDTNAARELITETNGKSIPMNSMQLSQAILSFLQKKTESTINVLDWDDIVDMYKEILEKICPLCDA